MKYCEKCKRNFPDNQIFCSECGNKLKEFVGSSNGTNTSNVSFINPNGGSSSKSSIWTPVIIAAVGALLGWFFSALLGVVLGGVGLKIAIQQKKQGQYKQLPFVLTWILAILDMIFWIIVIVA